MTDFRQATIAEIPYCWAIVDAARNNMIAIGRHQWTPLYPNLEVITADIRDGCGYVLIEDDRIVAYGAVRLNGEPEYERLLGGKWLTYGDYLVIHRLAVHPADEGRGLARHFFAETEAMAARKGIPSIKVDTNYDNGGMLHLMDILGYTYCGEVLYKNGYRRAYEKVITKFA